MFARPHPAGFDPPPRFDRAARIIESGRGDGFGTGDVLRSERTGQEGRPSPTGLSKVAGDVVVAFDDVSVGAFGDGCPLLLLHGAVQTRAVWEAQVGALAPRRRLIVPDLRGHGDTSLGHRPLTVEQLACDAFRLLDALQIQRAAICGVSLGGMVALEMAERSPDRVACLVLSNTPTSLTSIAWLRWLIDRLDPQELLPIAFRFLGQAATARLGLGIASRIVGPQWVGHVARRHFIRGFRHMSPEAIVATYGAIVSALPVDPGRIRCPTLLLAGRRDAPSIVAQMTELAGTLTDAHLEWVPAGHVASLDDPDGFNRLVLRFLDRQGV
jgi:pimeloyl-ACP methyl ester carboxylesterase